MPIDEFSPVTLQNSGFRQEGTVATGIVGYERVRRSQSERALALQLQRLAEIAEGGKPSAIRSAAEERSLPPPPLPSPLPLPVNVSPPYLSGEPNPEYRFNSTTGQVQATGPGINVWAWGNPRLGRISLGASGGNGPWGFVPLTGAWQLGDATAVSASLFEKITGGNVSALEKVSSIECAVEVTNGAVLSQISQLGAVICVAGKAGAPLDGFVGVTGALDVTATLLEEDSIVASQSTSSIFLEIGVNAQKPGSGYGGFDPSTVLYGEWQFDSAPERTIRGVVTLPVSLPPNRIVTAVLIEATIRVAGARGGVKDHHAGYFEINLSDSNHGGDPYFSSQAFFSLPRISLVTL